jgi:hypothetical protein
VRQACSLGRDRDGKGAYGAKALTSHRWASVVEKLGAREGWKRGGAQAADGLAEMPEEELGYFEKMVLESREQAAVAAAAAAAGKGKTHVHRLVDGIVKCCDV